MLWAPISVIRHHNSDKCLRQEIIFQHLANVTVASSDDRKWARGQNNEPVASFQTDSLFGGEYERLSKPMNEAWCRSTPCPSSQHIAHYRFEGEVRKDSLWMKSSSEYAVILIP